MLKVAIIGAGGVIFAQKMVCDLLLDPELRHAEIALMDIDPERLEVARKLDLRLAEQLGVQANFTATTCLEEAVRGAKYVITLFRVGTIEHARFEYEIPKKYGVDQVVGDSMCPGGIFRGLRTLKALFEVVDAMEKFSPGAMLLNYVNPMSINTIALSRRARTVRVVGLCHSVPNTIRELAKYLKLEQSSIRHLCCGVNHQAFFLKLEAEGRDLYPALREAMKDPEVYNHDKVRFELFRHFGYFPTESSGHNSEYNPFFRKRPELIAEFCRDDYPDRPIPWHSMSAGVSGASMTIVPLMQQENEQKVARLIRGEEPIPTEASNEYAIQVIGAIEKNCPLSANLNVINHGLISNLPPECSVEVPCLVDGGGVTPGRIEHYPEQLAGLNRMMINAQLLAAEGALEGDRDKVMWAVTLDPLTAAVCSLSEVRSMTDELFSALADQLDPRFSR